MPRESVLTAAERNQIRIEKLIFHIILKDEMQPRYLNEVTITDEQRSFFRDRLEDAASGRQFLFLDDSATKMKSEELVDCDDARFVQLSKELAADFRSHHGASTNNGVFIVSIASIGAPQLSDSHREILLPRNPPLYFLFRHLILLYHKQAPAGTFS